MSEQLSLISAGGHVIGLTGKQVLPYAQSNGLSGCESSGMNVLSLPLRMTGGG